jgi:hypothetical protein
MEILEHRAGDLIVRAVGQLDKTSPELQQKVANHRPGCHNSWWIWSEPSTSGAGLGCSSC